MAAVVVLGASLVQTAKPPVKPVVTFAAPASVKPGATVAATAKVAIPEGWHAYQNPPKSEFENPLVLRFPEKPSPFRLSGVRYPKGVAKTVAGVATIVYEGTVPIAFRISVPKAAKPGKATVPMTLAYQLCSDSTCLPPDDLPLRLALTVAR